MSRVETSHENKGVFASTFDALFRWAQKSSLWYVTTGEGCCVQEVTLAEACRYDLERFGLVPQVDPRQADLLFITSPVTNQSAPHVKALYEQMLSPKYVIAIGACACSGGIFKGYSISGGVDSFIPVDVFVPGCPPRPEAIMNGLIQLQEKIRGRR